MNLRSLTAPGIKSVRASWKAIVFIQACFIAFVVVFYTVPKMQSLPEQIQEFRNRVGAPVFVVGTIWFVSILVPELAKRITGTKADPITWRDLVLRLVYFAAIGLSVDALYTWMGNAYGNGPHLDSVAKKVATDMFLYSPLVSMPLAAITFLYRDTDFSWEQTKTALKQGEFWRRFMPLLVTCWMYFGPVTMAMYSLPVALNFPVAMTANAAWGIIVLSVGAHATNQGDNQ